MLAEGDSTIEPGVGRKRVVVCVSLGAAVGLVAACVPVILPPPPPIAVIVIPSDQTESTHGARHMAGYRRPVGVCDPCHGRDLRGTGEVRGCYSCHRQKWESGNPG
jgi:hypothetical protein